MWCFYGLQKISGTPETVIWSERYFSPGWQWGFDVPNSLPLIGFGAVVAWTRSAPRGLALFAAMALHAAADFATHHDDAHRHFWPLSDFRFASPVSYWDPRFHGDWMSVAELIVFLSAGVWLARAFPERGGRRIAAASTACLLAFAVFARVVWGGL